MFSFSISTYASDDDLINTIDLEFTALSYNAPDSNVENTTYDVSDDVDVSIFNTNGEKRGMIEYKFPHNSFDTKRLIATLVLFDDFSFNSNHEYNLNFKYSSQIVLPLSCVVQLLFYDNSGNLLKEQVIVTVTHEKENATKVHTIDIDFKPDVSDLSGGYKCVLNIGLQQNGFNHDTIYQCFYLSPEISLLDKDDDSGWFQKILNKINDLWETVKGIPDKITSKINELKESISLIITDLKENLIDGIKNLFIPDEEYLATKKEELEQFCIDHFGAVYQSLDVLIEFIVMLVNISPKEPMITFPAIDIPLFDTTYHLSDEVVYSFAWVNDKSHFLYYLYNFYRSFVTVILFLSFANYCRNKYNEVFGGGKE